MQFCPSENFQVFNCCLLPEESRCTACDIQATPRRTASAGWSANRTVSWKYSSDGSWYRCLREWAPSAPARRRSPWCWTCPSGRGAETRQTCPLPDYCLYHQIGSQFRGRSSSSSPTSGWVCLRSSLHHPHLLDLLVRHLPLALLLPLLAIIVKFATLGENSSSLWWTWKARGQALKIKKSLPATSFYDEQLLSDP